jgi:hypothetical protein
MLTEIIVVSVLFLLCWYFLPTGSYIVNDVIDGKTKVQSSEQEKTQFSYTCWIRVDDFDYGEQKVIFVKGSPSLEHACPALVLDGNTNTLLVKIDTFGAQETIPILSVPAKKWMHVGIVVQEHQLNVYINGIEYASQTLIQLPKTNSGQVLVSPQGFSGRVAKLQFYPRILAYSEITAQSKSIPSTSESEQVFPPYFDVSWFRTY